MKRYLKTLSNNILHNDNIVYTFLRSIASSQAASWVDLGIGMLLFALFPIQPVVATAIGAVCGGIVNCIINYRFTFHASDCDWHAVIVKYAMVWIGSVLLNSFGTQGLYALLTSWDWLETIGFKPDGYFAAARLTVSLIVSWAWNFMLQRYFVYRVTKFDPKAIRIMKAILPRRKSNECKAEQKD